MSRLNQGGSGRNFLYRFDIDGSQNFVKKMHVGPEESDKYPGASHCDELPYLFKTKTNISSPTLDSLEFDVIKKMVETFTTFAASGDPNNPEMGSHWHAIESLELPYHCMNISNNKIGMEPLPESATLKVWNEVFESENESLC
jgi:cholinesterase